MFGGIADRVFSGEGLYAVTNNPLGSSLNTLLLAPPLHWEAQPAAGARRQLDLQTRPRLASQLAPRSNLVPLFQTVLG